jgi:hypothetical protein
MPLAKIGAWKRLAVWHSGVNPHLLPTSIAHGGCEEPELANRAPSLSLDPPTRQASFQNRAIDEWVADVEDPLGNRLKERSALLQRRLTISIKRGPSERAGPINVVCATAGEWRIEDVPCRRIDAMEGCVCATERGRTDQHFTGDQGMSSS